MPDPIAGLIGSYVLIRDTQAGVFFGRLLAVDLAAKTWCLDAGARKVHFWRRAGAVEGVGVRGIDPKESRVTAPISRPGAGCALVQVYGLTEPEYASLAAVPEWRP